MNVDSIKNTSHRTETISQTAFFLRYLYAHRIFFGSGVFIVLLALMCWLIRPTLADVAVFYPSSCLGGWEHPENATGEPTLPNDAEAKLYSTGNSARIVGTSATLYCGGWKGKIPENTKPKVFTFSLDWSVDDGSVVHTEPQPFNYGDSDTVNSTPESSDASPSETSHDDGPQTSGDTTPAVQSFLQTIFATPAFAEDDVSSDTVPTTTESQTDVVTSSPDVSVSDTTTSPSVSTATETGLNPLMKVEYTLDGANWKTLGTVDAHNWQHASFVVALDGWDTLEHFQVSLTPVATIDRAPVIYVDAVKLTVDYDSIDDQLFPPTVKLDDAHNGISGNTDFKPNDAVEFDVAIPNLDIGEIKTLVEQGNAEVVTDTSNVLGMKKDTPGTLPGVITTGTDIIPDAPSLIPKVPPSDTLQDPLLDSTSSSPMSFLKSFLLPTIAHAEVNKVSAVVKTFYGDSTDIDATIVSVVENGVARKKVQVHKPERSFKPGRYTLEVTFTTPQAVFVSEQDFNWGVLAINTDTSVYTPGDNAYLQMAVLNDGGHTLCNADLDLTITTPGGVATHLSTGAGTIIREPQCGPDNVILVPDYYAHYSIPNETGSYSMLLTAHTDKGDKSITDNFTVATTTPYVISRVGPTRIYPVATYPVALHVSTQNSFSGLVTEQVPASFDITQPETGMQYASVVTDGDTKIITWDVSVTPSHEIVLGYQFLAPPVSPEFYVLGEASFVQNGVAVFTESRYWQIASDAACNATTTGTWGTGTDTASFTSCTGSATTGTGTGNRPGAADALTINAGVTLTVTSNQSVGSIAIASPTTANGLSINTGVTLTVTNASGGTGAVTYTANATANAQTITLNGTGGISAVSLTIPAPTSTGASLVTCAASATGTFSTSGAVSITGNSTSTGAVTLGMATCTLAATGLTTITGGTNATGVPTISSSTGTLTFGGGLTFAGTVANAKLTATGAATITLTGTMSGAGTLSIASATFRTTGTAAIGAAYTLPNLNVLAGTTTMNSFAITISGATSISGTLTNATGATLKTFTGLVTVNSGGSFLMNVVTNPTLSFGGGIAMNGTSFNSGTGTTTLTATQSFSGSSAMTVGAAISIPTGTTLTISNTNTVTFSSTITMPIGSPNLVIATGANVVSSTLAFTANSTAGGAQLVTMQGTGNFSPSAITMPATTSTGTAKITAASGATGTLTVSGTVAITGSATTSGGLSSIDFGTTSTAVNLTTGAMTVTAGTISGAQVIMGTGTLTTNGLMTLAAAASGTAPASFSTTTGLVNIKAGLTFSGTVIANASFTTGATTITLTGTMTGLGTMSIASATFKTTGTAAFNAAYTLPNLTVITGTTTMNSFAIIITGTTTIQSGGILTNATGATLKTFIGLVNVQSGGSFNLNVATACTVEFRGGIQVDSGATSFATAGATSFTTNNQSISGTGTIALSFGATTITTSTITLSQNYTGNTVTFATLTLVSPTAAYGLDLATGTNTTSTGLISFPANATIGAFSEDITLNGTANLTAGSITMTAPTTTVSGATEGIVAASGASGTVTITGATSITGGATGTQFTGIDLSAGTGALSVAALTISGGALGVGGVKLGTGNLTISGALTGGGTTANAQLTTGANTILFNGGSTAATVVTLSIASATLNTQGTVTFGGVYTFPNLNVLSGTTTMGGVAITISGATSVTGTLASSSATGTKTFTGNVTVQSGGSFNLSGFATVTAFTGNITMASGASTFNTGTGTTTFNGGVQSINGAVNMTFGGAVTINSGCTLTNNSTATVFMSSTLTLAVPTVANGMSLASGSTTTITGALAYSANSTANNETITLNGTANISAGSLTVIAPTSTGNELFTCASGATGTFSTSGAMTVNGNSTSTGQATLAMDTCTLSSGGLLTISGGTNATGVATVSSTTGTLTAGAGITFGGTVANAKLNTTGAGTINLTGTVTGAATPSINSGTTLVSTGTSALNGAYTWGNLSVPSGTLSLGGFAMTFAGATSLTGGSIASTSATGVKTFTSTVTVTTGSFDLSAFATATSFAGGITMNGTTWNTSTGATTFTASQNLAGSSAMIFGGATTINNSVTLTNNNTSTVDFNSNLLGGGASANFTTGANSTTNLAGTVMATGTLTPSISANTIVYDGGTQTVEAPTTNPYYNLTIGTAGVKSLSGATSVANTLTISAGSLDTVSGQNYALGANDLTIGASGTLLGQGATITVTGNWSNSGIFTPATSTVLFNGGNTATISGTTTFNNLTITHTATKQVNFQTSGAPIFTISGLFTVTGHTGALITLRSDATPTQWQIKPTGTSSLTYLDVMDSACQSGSVSMSPTNFTNSGNNGTCWSPPSISFSISDSTVGFGTLTTANACFATGDTLGSATDVVAHTMQVSTNAVGGFVISYYGALPTSGSNTIPAASITNSATGTPGTEQFAMSYATNGSSTVNASYLHDSTPSLRDWAFIPNTTTNIISNTSPVSSPETISAYYIGNIAGSTKAGNYATNITYVATGTF